MIPKKVWYVSYGSNMDEERLMEYINKCSDTSAPLDRKKVKLSHRLFFNHETKSVKWVYEINGKKVHPCVSFISAEPVEGEVAYGVAYKISFNQFKELYKQENGMTRQIELSEADYGKLLAEKN